MTVIAMTREMGTLGNDVAAGIADALGLEVIHHELVEHQLAERLQLGDNTVHRFLEGHASLWERWKIDTRRMSRYTVEEVLHLVRQGNVVIRGWGAAQLLRGVPHVLRVRVCAPMPNRIATMKERLGITDEREVRHEIERNDNAHSNLIQHQFGNDWRNPDNYDIVLNTGYVPIDTCVSLLRQLAESPAYRETAVSRRILVDRIIEADVRRLLESRQTDTPFGSGLHLQVREGNVRLSGILGVRGDMTALIEQIEQIDGVVSVENDITVANVSSGV